MGIVKDWFVSSYSAEGNTCVQARVHADGSIDVRNKQNPDAGTATFTGADWSAFLADVKSGAYDLA